MRWASGDGVSPSAAESGAVGNGRLRSGAALRGVAGLGRVRQGLISARRAYGPSLLGSLNPDVARQGAAM